MDWGALAAVALGYLLGSIPFGVVTTRLAGKGDLRAVSSGNIGATNVLRTGSKALAALTLLGDAAKGTAAVLIGAAIGNLAPLAAGLGAFFGHVFPVWLRFRGGKGVATYLGILAGLDWRVALGFAAVWIAVAAASRISSASGLAASVAAPVGLAAIGSVSAAVVMALLTIVLWFRHAANIRRLVAGTERRIGE